VPRWGEFPWCWTFFLYVSWGFLNLWNHDAFELL
jgi:hypothetical protein